MLRSDPYPIDALSFTSQAAAVSQRPVHVRPAAEEALVSWLWRLATRLGVSMSTLSRMLIGAKVTGEALAWCRPGESVLQQIAARTGTDIEQLRVMTFHALSPSVRDDEVNDRFCGRRFMRSGRESPFRARISVCPTCLREGPYLRWSWMLGWISVCSRHGTVLLSHCPRCAQRLSLPSSEAHRLTAIDRCASCKADLSAAPESRAAVEVVNLEEAMLLGKRRGLIELPALGAIGWLMATAMMDVLLTLVRVGTTLAYQEHLYGRIARDFHSSLGEVRHWSARYGSSLTLAWLLKDWPRNMYRSYSLLHSARINHVIARCTELDEALRDSIPRAVSLGQTKIPNGPICRPPLDRQPAAHCR